MTDLVKVTQEQFYGVIYKGALNVHPRSERDMTFWEFPNRALFGTSLPGYANPGAPKTYAIARNHLPADLAKAARAAPFLGAEAPQQPAEAAPPPPFLTAEGKEPTTTAGLRIAATAAAQAQRWAEAADLWERAIAVYPTTGGLADRDKAKMQQQADAARGMIAFEQGDG